MTRKDLQQLANTRIREAKHLLLSNNFSGAYYLAGYTIELGLKACIARKTRKHDFPELNVVRDSFTHDFKKLVKVAGLEQNLNSQIAKDLTFATNWTIVKDWDQTPDIVILLQTRQRKLFIQLYHGKAEY